MRLPRRFFQTARSWIAIAILVHLLFIIAAAVQPGVHHWMHADAGHEDHQCAITLFATGSYDDAPVPVIAAAPKLISLPDEVAVERPRFASSFRFSGILEHAPPRRA